jgi:hypothetical protein
MITDGLSPKPCISMQTFIDVSNLPAFPIESTSEEKNARAWTKVHFFHLLEKLKSSIQMT